MGNSNTSPSHIDKHYPFKDVKVPYRSETLKINTDEEKSIRKWLELSELNKDEVDDSPKWEEGKKLKIIFDTDIGTDIDDALALLMLLHFPGITTVYGYTQIRATVARKIVEEYARGKKVPNNIPVFAGEGVPIGTHRSVWHTGTEGISILETDEITKLQAETPGSKKDRYEASKFIVSQVMKYPGEVVVIGLGALTNIAIAIKTEPKFAKNVKRFVYMGMGHRLEESQTTLFDFQKPDSAFEPGKVYFHYPNHNISSDTKAAEIAFAAEMNTYVINDQVTNELWFSEDAAQAILNAADPPENKVVGDLLKVWLSYRSMIFYSKVTGTCPHDPLTVTEAIYPGAKYARGHLMIHEWAGFPTFVLDPKGPHRIGVSINDDDFLMFLAKYLVPTMTFELHQIRKPEKKKSKASSNSNTSV